jgi:ferric enterobactin receptor
VNEPSNVSVVRVGFDVEGADGAASVQLESVAAMRTSSESRTSELTRLEVMVGMVRGRVQRRRHRHLRILLGVARTSFRSVPVHRQFVIWMLLASSVAAQAGAQVRLEGHVRSADGAPVAGAIMRLSGLDIQPLSTTTDADGHYVFPAVRGTWIVLVAWADGRPIAKAGGLVTLPTEVINLTANPSVSRPSSAMDLDPMEGTAGTLRGTVRAADGAAVGGAQVAIRDTPVATTTDTFGRFDFGRIRAGLSLTLEASSAGYTAVDQTVAIVAGEITTAAITLAAESTVSSGLAPGILGISPRTETTTISSASVTGLAAPRPGDTNRALQLLPDIRGSLEDPSSFPVRRGSPDQTAVTYEGMTLYSFPGLRGMFGGFDAAAISTADLSEDSLGSPLAGLPSGVNLRALSGAYPSRPTGFFEASAFGVGGRVVVPIAGRVAIRVAARQNPPDRLYENVLDRYSSGQGLFVPTRVPAFTGGPLAASPTVGFHDVNATVDVRFTAVDGVSVSYYDARDAANLSRNVDVPGSSSLNVPNPDVLPDVSIAEVSDVYEWTGHGASATWRRRWSPRVASSLSFGQTEFEKSDARASLLRNATTGEDYSFFDGRNGSDALTNANSIRHASVRFEGRVDVGFRHGLSFGGEIADLAATYAGRVERVVLPAAGPPSGRLVASGDQAASGGLIRVFASDLWRPTSKLTLSLGARVVRFELDPAVHIEPLASATYSWRPGVAFVAGWSVSHQAAIRITREDRLRGDTEFWVLANGNTIPIPRVEQWSGGARFERTGVALAASMFYKRFDNLTIFAPVHTPVYVAASLDPVLHTGSGRAAGVNLLLQSQTRLNDIWVSYAGGRTVQSFPTLGAGTFVASSDRTHEFKVADTWRVAGPWSLSATFVAASGLPTTSVAQTVVWLGTEDEVYRAEFGNKNTSRLPAYHRLDLSSDVTVSLGQAALTIGATVFNAYNRANIRYRTWEIAGSSIDSDDRLFIGRVYNAFVRVAF